MMSHSLRCSNPKAIKELTKAYKKNKLFSRGLKTNLFMVIVEILKNSTKDVFKDCFSNKTKNLLWRNKNILKKLTSTSTTKKKGNHFLSIPDRKLKKLS